MKFSKEDADLIDNFLTALRNHNEPTLYMHLYKQQHSTVNNIEKIPKLMNMVVSYQKERHRDLISINGEGVDRRDDLDWFISNGGFNAVWDEEEKERILKADIKTVNDSVKETNKAVKYHLPYQLAASITAVLISATACIISYMAYNNSNPNDEIKTRLKQLEVQQTKTDQQILQSKQLTVADTVHAIIVIDSTK